MPKKKSEKDASLRAWGQLFAEGPAVEALLDCYRDLPDDLAEDERRKLVVERFHEFVLEIDQSDLGDGVLTPELLGAPVWDIARQLLDAAEEHFGPVSVKDVLVRLLGFGGVDEIAYSWVKQTAETGEPAPYPALMHGAMVTLQVPGGGLDGGPLPVVVAAVTPDARMDDVVRELRDTCYESFKDCQRPTAGIVAEMARMMELMKQGKTRGQIAWQLLADRTPEIAALPDKERRAQYQPEHKSEMARIRQLLNRLPKERDRN